MSEYKHKDDIEVHYPVTVMQREHTGTEELNAQLARTVLELENKFRDTAQNAVNEGLVSTQGGYQTSTRMNLMTVDEPAVRRFRDDIVMPGATAYLESVFGEAAAQLNPWPVAWANILREGDWQGPHIHPTEKNVASAVYYVSLPEEKPKPQGWIEFINPQLVSVNHGFPTTRRLEPSEGKLIFFPPFYMHYVHPFRGPGQRIIIAMDILAQKPGMEFVF